MTVSINLSNGFSSESGLNPLGIKPGSQYRQHYLIAMPEPASHLFEITIRFEQINRQEPWVLKFPVWTPGSYLVREYARFVQDVRATEIRGDQWRVLPCRKQDKHTWWIPADPEGVDPEAELATIQVQYRLYANDLTVRTNHLNTSHGYFNGAATFMYAPVRQSEPLVLTVEPPNSEWKIATSLKPVHRNPLGMAFHVADFDQLVDSPVEVGLHQRRDFEIMGKPHQLVVWGEGAINLEQAVQDIEAIVPVAAGFFGSLLPYETYLFLLHLSADGFGGLEHRDSTSLIFSRFGFHQPDSYRRFLALVAHEFFHTWNVKRLRPQILERYNYQQESYLTCLWFCEGATSYYENRILRHAGLMTEEQFLTVTAERIARLEKAPGQQVQALSESSFDTWIKLYRPHENSNNSQISYYLKGALVCWLLDLHIRHVSKGSHSLDTVMQDLWQRFGSLEKGYTDQELQAACERASGGSLDDWFAHYIDSSQPMDYASHLDPFGLVLKTGYSSPNPPPYLGLNGKDGSTITTVEMGSPAQQAGIWAGDELLALDGFKVTIATLPDRLRAYAPGQTVSVSVFQQEILRTVAVTLADPIPDRYSIEQVPDPTPEQQALYQEWLGTV